ncbi:ATP-dependent helicase [archaeon]|nr:MAG: ATP-dependent helicase [archaeon]
MSAQNVDHMTEMRWDDGLLGAAKRIAEIDHSPIRVLAGPGTGKTFALMRRVARLLQNGETANRILVCTFTRTAARDLQRELLRLGIDGTDKVRATTLHSLCFSLLSREEVLEFTGRVPRPLLAFEERFLVEDLKGDGFGGVHERSRRLQAFNAAWARLQSDDPGWPQDPVDQDFQRGLLQWLRFHQAILIGELVPETLRYLRDNPASPHRGVFKHVLVDEYQDLNRAEQELLDFLAERGHLIIAGDKDQSIYSFKFAHPEGVATFDQTHPDTYDERLDECRRCPTRVVEMANALIAQNYPSRKQPALRSMANSPEGEILVLQWRSIEEEAQGIAELIRMTIQNAKVDSGRVLVLSPRRHFGYAIRNALNSH